MKYVYENKSITCNKKDARVIRRLKYKLDMSSTNQVIHYLLFFYINSGEIPESEKPILLGKEYYNDYKNR